VRPPNIAVIDRRRARLVSDEIGRRVEKRAMTNANVEQMVTGVDGQTLTMKYKDGEKKIIVSPDTPAVTCVPGDKSELKPGAKIFIAAAKKMPDGTLQAARVNVGKDGITPLCNRSRITNGVNC
jgi:hypothetical protein